MASPQPNTLSLPPPPPSSSSDPTPKKSQPIPWSHQETLALIQSYQQKWYSLNKGQLKAFQWEQVVASVAQLCGLQVPSKTSTQCRHKIEKLRKRYRQEATKPYPDSWQYFQLMDQMERGPNAPVINYNRLNNSNYSVVVGGSSSNGNNNNVVGTRRFNSSNNNSRVVVGGGGVESDESDEEWSVGLDGSRSRSRTSNKRSNNKSKSINNLVRSEDGRFVGVLRDRRSGKRKDFYGYSSEEDEGVEEEGYNNDVVVAGEKYEDVVEEEEEGSVVGRELAKEIRAFAESFVRMESGKMKMMREKERRRMEMEKRRMEMIIGAQRKVVETIGRAFETDKKPRMG